MIRLSTLIWPVVIGLVAFLLFQVKDTVSKLTEELADIRSEIAETESNLEVLQAEWAHLNNPAYLRELTQKYLVEEGPVQAHIGSINDIPMSTAANSDSRNNQEQQLVIGQQTETPIKDLITPAPSQQSTKHGSYREQYSLDEIRNLIDLIDGRN
jgi:hypothetical protein